ncbi:MAG: cytochrome c [Acidimicrobiia bacterium]|nr:cytochrome c [Acidimicrobiia bacterium]
MRKLLAFSAVWMTLAIAAQSTWAEPAGKTFTKDVAPILFKNCVACHRPGEVAPMSLLDYETVRPWAKSIRKAVLSRKMPPWFADPAFGAFANDPRLSDQEISTIKAWVDGGSPEGDPRDLPPKPAFVEGWKLGKPDIVIDIGQDFAVAPGNDAYEYFTVPTNFTEGKWIRAAEILPGNRQVVHHVHVSLVMENNKVDGADSKTTAFRTQTGQFWEVKVGLSRVRLDAPVVDDACANAPTELQNLSGFEEGSFTAMLPGKAPDVFGDKTPKWIPAGAKLRFQVHYAKVETPQTDRTRVGFYLASRPPERPMRRFDLRNRYFLIPAGAANHEVKRCYEFESDKLLVSITPHMHYRGKDARYELVRPNGRRETLLYVSPYNFEWQLLYRFREPIYVEKGSRMIVTFHYDNSPNHRGNPDPTQVVRWGDRSEDEMMTSWIEYLDAGPSSFSRQTVTETAARARPAGP